jgi:hypothetical protein
MRDITKEQKVEIQKIIQEDTNKAIAEFDGLNIKGTPKVESKFPRVYDLYTFENGKLNRSDKLTNQQESYMISRIQRINQQMHGVYNTLDRNAIQSTMLGEVVMQFRKWMWSTWTRYMGVKFNVGLYKRRPNQPFDEAMGRHRNGAFNELFGFITKPIHQAYLQSKTNGDVNPKVEAFKILFNSIGDMITDYSFNWHTLTKDQQSDVLRGVAFFANFLLISLAVLAVSAFSDDDEERNKFESTLIYITAGLQTEYVDMLPLIGWFNFYNRTKESVVPIERQVFTVAKLAKDLAYYPFQSEEERIHKRGIYKGQTKVNIGVQKLIPIWRQVFKWNHMEAQVQYYNMYNPMSNIWN